MTLPWIAINLFGCAVLALLLAIWRGQRHVDQRLMDMERLASQTHGLLQYRPDVRLPVGVQEDLNL